MPEGVLAVFIDEKTADRRRGAFLGFAVLFSDWLDVLVERLVESSRTPHASPQCLSACAYLGIVLCGLMHGLAREEVLDADWESARKLRKLFPLHAEILDVTQGGFRS